MFFGIPGYALAHLEMESWGCIRGTVVGDTGIVCAAPATLHSLGPLR